MPDGYIMQCLTGQRLRTPILSYLPGCIGIISKSAPVGHIWGNAMKIVSDYSALPYFVYFLPARERQEWASRLVAEKSSQSISMALGLTMFPISPVSRHPRYCPQCVIDQIREFGFSFFRRHHQLPGVLVCAEHEEILSYGCSVCGPYPIKNRGLSMPGRCKCELLTPLPVIPNHTDITQLLWIARESEFMVNSAGTGHDDPRSVLKEVAVQKGFGRGTIIDYRKLASGIEARFGKDVLKLTGLQIWTDNQPAAWIRRLLQSSGKDKKKPSIQLLLVIGVLFDSICDFEAWQKSEVPISAGVGKKSAKCVGLKILIDNNYKVTEIAKHYGVGYGTVIREIRQQGLTLPLSNRIRNALGAKLDLIRQDLIAGIPKKKIMSKYGCCEETLILIEIDRPIISENHRQTTRSKVREKHRTTLIAFLKLYPNAGRAKIMAALPTCYDYFMRVDREWFFEQIPERKKADQLTLRTPRINWQLLDEQKSQELKQVVGQLYDSNEKPIRVTKFGLLKSIGLQSKYCANTCRFEKVGEILSRYTESHEEFIVRRITWAVRQYENKDDGLSINNLRRVADVSAQVLRDHKQLVCNLAIKFNIKLRQRSFFAASVDKEE